MLPEILDKSGAKLNEEAAAATEALREAIWQRTGLALPAVTFYELAVKSGPGGKALGEPESGARYIATEPGRGYSFRGSGFTDG